MEALGDALLLVGFYYYSRQSLVQDLSGTEILALGDALDDTEGDRECWLETLIETEVETGQSKDEIAVGCLVSTEAAYAAALALRS